MTSHSHIKELMNNLTKKFRIKNGLDFEIYAEHEGCYYGRIGVTPASWVVKTLANRNAYETDNFDLELIEPEQPKTPDIELKDGGKYLLRNGETTKVSPSGNKNGYPFRGDNGFLYTENGSYNYGGEIHGCDLVQETTEENDFATQQEIWAWLMDGNKVINVHSNDVCFFENGKLNNSHYFACPEYWEKYTEPKKTEWFDLLDGTEENAMVCWLTCVPYTLFIAFKTETKGGIEYIYNDNQSCVYENQIQPIMPLSEFKKLYPYPL